MRLLACIVMLIGCDGAAPGEPSGNGVVFEPAVTDVVIEIDHETGQEPFTGAMLGQGDTFDLSDANIDRLFGGRKQITLPRTPTPTASPTQTR